MWTSLTVKNEYLDNNAIGFGSRVDNCVRLLHVTGYGGKVLQDMGVALHKFQTLSTKQRDFAHSLIQKESLFGCLAKFLNDLEEEDVDVTLRFDYKGLTYDEFGDVHMADATVVIHHAAEPAPDEPEDHYTPSTWGMF